MKNIFKSNLSQLLTDIIVGTMLGDAKMEFSNKGNARFIYELSAKHKEYLCSVFASFTGLVSKEPLEHKHFDKRTGNSTTSIRFRTITSPLFYPFAIMFYTRVPDTRKVIKVLPAIIDELLTPRALAY
jgi:hypothetical protein